MVDVVIMMMMFLLTMVTRTPIFNTSLMILTVNADRPVCDCCNAGPADQPESMW
jgi:hypothetical protein